MVDSKKRSMSAYAAGRSVLGRALDLITRIQRSVLNSNEKGKWKRSNPKLSVNLSSQET
jgi:hypothetical protein